MARHEDDYDDDESFDFGSLPDDQQRDFLYDTLGFTETASDYEAHNLFWEVMYNDELTSADREILYQQLLDHIWDEYGIDFDELWDWAAFREWYDSV